MSILQKSGARKISEAKNNTIKSLIKGKNQRPDLKLQGILDTSRMNKARNQRKQSLKRHENSP